MHLIIVERLKPTIKVVKVLILDKKVEFCDNTLQNTLRDVGLMIHEKIPKSYLS